MEIAYQPIYGYLHCGKCSAGTDAFNRKHATRNKAKKFVTMDGVLHYIAKEWIIFQKKESHPH